MINEHLKARLPLLIAVLGIMALIGAGCGDDESTSGSATGGNSNANAEADSDGGSSSDEQSGEAPAVETSSLSKAEFVKRANAACTREGKGLLSRAEAFQEGGGSKGQSPQEANAELVKKVLLPTVEAQTAALVKLGAPEGDEEELEAILAARREDIASAEEVKRGKSVTEIIEEEFSETDETLEEYGLSAC